MSAIATALLIFSLRIVDVSIGTVRVIYTIRGARLIATILGFFESLVWIYAISRLVATVGQSPVNMVAWAIGFSSGTALGITLEQWIATGEVMIRIISIFHSEELSEKLREKGFGVTSVRGEGKDGSILILFVAAPRRRGDEVMKLIETVDSEAFTTIEPLSNASGGYLPSRAAAAGMRK